MVKNLDDAAGHPLFRLGFRPFFLGAAIYAVLALALWAAVYLGLFAFMPRGGALVWHLHEMPFGFASAVITGFLLTAVQNWTGSPGLHGPPLAALFILWLTARIGWLWSALPWPLVAALELSFLPSVAARLAWQLGRVRQRRNYPLVVLLLLLTAADATTVYAHTMGGYDLLRRAVWAALWLIGAIITIIGGRIIPLFTANALKLPPPAELPRWLEAGAPAGLLLLALLAVFGLGFVPDARLVSLFILLTILHGWRVLHWFHPGILGVPLLWSLHLGYAWL